MEVIQMDGCGGYFLGIEEYEDMESNLKRAVSLLQDLVYARRMVSEVITLADEYLKELGV